VISCVLANRPALGLQQAALAMRIVLGGPDPLDRIVMLAEEELRRGITAVTLGNRLRRRLR